MTVLQLPVASADFSMATSSASVAGAWLLPSTTVSAPLGVFRRSSCSCISQSSRPTPSDPSGLGRLRPLGKRLLLEALACFSSALLICLADTRPSGCMFSWPWTPPSQTSSHSCLVSSSIFETLERPPTRFFGFWLLCFKPATFEEGPSLVAWPFLVLPVAAAASATTATVLRETLPFAFPSTFACSPFFSVASLASPMPPIFTLEGLVLMSNDIVAASPVVLVMPVGPAQLCTRSS
mmetsp:Transcript_69186/g.165896  ORF Transcript_69186/g.165896 Transcript_69186/m.165896 type:complete len:237 (-) Transcript_69186:105-815(-)